MDHINIKNYTSLPYVSSFFHHRQCFFLQRRRKNLMIRAIKFLMKVYRIGFYELMEYLISTHFIDQINYQPLLLIVLLSLSYKIIITHAFAIVAVNFNKCINRIFPYNSSLIFACTCTCSNSIGFNYLYLKCNQILYNSHTIRLQFRVLSSLLFPVSFLLFFLLYVTKCFQRRKKINLIGFK